MKRSNDRRSLVSFESESGKEPQDFQLFYTISKEDFGLTLLTHREPGKQGYFLLMISPKDDWSEQEYSAKDVVFVVDTSGSMAEEGKMEKARAALLYGVRILRPQDRFNIISFAGEEHLMEAGLIAADEKGRARGEAFVKRLKPVGGTNINQSLLASLRQFSETDRERPKMLVFMTDGLPTVDETNVSRIIDNVRKATRPGVRLFTFGVGYDVNTALLDKLAAENGGVADYVEPKEDLEVKVSNFFSKVNYPVLTDLQLDMGGAQTDLIYPRGIPDVFRGSQVTLIGRYSNEADLKSMQLKLTGKSGGAMRSYTYAEPELSVAHRCERLSAAIVGDASCWLADGAGALQRRAERVARRDRGLGTRYGIVTPYTSYLALEDASRSLRRQHGHHALTASSGDGRWIWRPECAQRSRASESDRRRVESQAQKRAAKQDAARAAGMYFDAKGRDMRKDAVKRVAGKTFYLIEGVWTDSEFKAESKLPETVLVFGSDEYFALLKQNPKLGSYFSLGERVVIVFDGRVYRVTAK